ncbi:hypothetical protein [Falsochrobactrum tianjinense]|uniref:hypothetical protein n=1 Tax=Falsochrobactrum tianjinense TaxID=2706015 RepID=UPI003BEEB6BD
MTGSTSSTTKKKVRFTRLLREPLFWLVFVVAVLAGLLVLPLIVPIGPMYWDTYLYLDAAQRIKTGQIPAADFLTPVGPLGYYLFSWGLHLFPNAQPLLLAQWSLLAVAAPLMAMVLAELGPQNRSFAFALLVPFLVFAIFPANAQSFHSYPGLDGFGIYNRQSSLLLYVLTCGLMFLRDGRKLALFCALAMLCLFLTKITGFLVGGLFGLTALLAGRISVKSVLIAAVITVVGLLVLEMNGHMISAYIDSIVRLVAANDDVLLPRFLTVMSGKLDVILPASLLILVLFWIETSRQIHASRLFDSGYVWLAITLLGGIILETQNTGSQEFIFLWPLLLMIYQRLKHIDGMPKLAFVILTAFCVIPTFSQVSHKTLRAIAVAPTYVQPSVTEVRNLGQVSTKKGIMERVLLLKQHYTDYPQPYEALAEAGQLPSWRLYAELDYQMFWIMEADEAVKAVKRFEAENGIRLNSLMALDFTDPFPWLLDREATREIQIGADPSRTVTKMTPETRAAVEATDGILQPKCPATTARLALYKIYSSALQDREVVEIDPCWNLLLRPGLVKK